MRTNIFKVFSRHHTIRGNRRVRLKTPAPPATLGANRSPWPFAIDRGRNSWLYG